MTTLCLQDLSERDFATLSRLPRREQRMPDRLDSGSVALNLAKAILPERLQLTALPSDDRASRSPRVW